MELREKLKGQFFFRRQLQREEFSDILILGGNKRKRFKPQLYTRQNKPPCGWCRCTSLSQTVSFGPLGVVVQVLVICFRCQLLQHIPYTSKHPAATSVQQACFLRTGSHPRQSGAASETIITATSSRPPGNHSCLGDFCRGTAD